MTAEQTLTDLRAKARAIFDKAVEAADPALALRKQLASDPFPVPENGQTHLIAIGKAAPAMLAEAIRHVTGPYTAFAITHYENEMDVPDATVMRSAHPVPDENGLKAGQEIISRLNAASSTDQVIALISGGGSALVPTPVEGVSLADKAAVNQLLLQSGLDIVQMNLVRQQLSQLKGGGFLRHAAPAPVSAYILSDVIGDDLRAVASGPTVAPIGTRQDARRILTDAGVWDQTPPSVRAHLSAVTDTQNAPAPAHNHLIGSNRQSLEAAATEAKKYFDINIVSDHLVGNVGDAATEVIDAGAKSGTGVALLFGGETTVRLTGTGLGGRNQELALRVALARDEIGGSDWVFLSGGTDGRDGPTEAAGGLVDAGTRDRIIKNGQDPDALLANNDSNAALASAGDLLLTQATGTNVADIQIFLRA